MKQLPEVNQDIMGRLKDITCFALDMDGTVYLGTKWIEGAMDFLKAVEEVGKQYIFLTNNSSKGPENYVEKLAAMGLTVTKDRIVTSGQATISYLKKYYPGKRVYLLGNELLKREFQEEGILLAENDPEVVVTGFDTSLTYEKLCRVCDHVRAGLPYIATHPDYNCPTEDGFIPDIGSFHELIHASAFRYPDHVVGKPSGDIMDYLAGRAGTSRAETAMVGDRLYTDVAAGVNNGYTGILVLSGEATLADAEEAEVTPDLIFTSVKEMIPFL